MSRLPHSYAGASPDTTEDATIASLVAAASPDRTGQNGQDPARQKPAAHDLLADCRRRVA